MMRTMKAIARSQRLFSTAPEIKRVGVVGLGLMGHGTLKRVEMMAALGSGSAPPPSLPQPRPRATRWILGSAPTRFEATSQPSSGPPKATSRHPLQELLKPRRRKGLRWSPSSLRPASWTRAWRG